MKKFQNKFELIKKLVKDKIVLDIGCVEVMSNFTLENMKKTQHYKLKAIAKHLIGVDLEKEGVDRLNELGCECYNCFAEEIYIHNLSIKNFDVIILGDIIEHIPNPSTFLLSLSNLLNENGIIICSTPNCLNYKNFVRLFFHRPFTRHQHTAWYCKVTLKNLFKLSGYDEDETYFGVYWSNRNPIQIFERLLFKINEEYAPQLIGIYKKNKEFQNEDIQELQRKRVF